ncbi:hypothetical protein Tco_1166274 [Tanacetum coccineum]
MPTALAGGHGAKADGASDSVVGANNFWAGGMALDYQPTISLALRITGFLRGVVPQIPLSVFNSVIAVCDNAQIEFMEAHVKEKEEKVKKIS